MLNAAGDKSFVDDLAASGYCKCESSLCCYEALRFIPCFYDLFFFVFKISICEFPRHGPQLRETVYETWMFEFWRFCVCKNRRPFTVGSAFPFLPFKKSVCQHGVSHFCQREKCCSSKTDIPPVRASKWSFFARATSGFGHTTIQCLTGQFGNHAKCQTGQSCILFFFGLNALESAYWYLDNVLSTVAILAQGKPSG